jgi:hypothetical protein
VLRLSRLRMAPNKNASTDASRTPNTASERRSSLAGAHSGASGLYFSPKLGPRTNFWPPWWHLNTTALFSAARLRVSQKIRQLIGGSRTLMSACRPNYLRADPGAVTVVHKIDWFACGGRAATGYWLVPLLLPDIRITSRGI